MKYDKPVLYNLLLPFWVLIFVPSWLWLILIPLNYLLDRIVLRWSLGDMPDRGLFCRRHTWKLCLIGFMGDIIGAVFMVAALFLTALPGALHENTAHPLLDKITYGVGFNPFSNILSFVIVLAAIFLAGLILRMIISWLVEGYMVDVNCFLSWGGTMASAGPARFYEATSFCDYPPLYTHP